MNTTLLKIKSAVAADISIPRAPLVRVLPLAILTVAPGSRIVMPAKERFAPRLLAVLAEVPLGQALAAAHWLLGVRKRSLVQEVHVDSDAEQVTQLVAHESHLLLAVLANEPAGHEEAATHWLFNRNKPVEQEVH